MALTTLDDYIGSVKNVITWNKTALRTTVAAVPFSMFDIAGNPGAGTLNAGNTANGVVPTDATSGYPIIPAITGTGYISRIMFNSTVAGRISLYDRVFSCGAYSFNADTTLTSQPSFISRLPNANYEGLELWIEAVTAFTGNQTVQINYIDQDGNAGDTGAIATGVAPIIGRMLRIPLAAGDSGIQTISRVRSSVSTVGTFNVHIMRKLWDGRINIANAGTTNNLLDTGFPIIYETSALFPVITADSTSSGLPQCDIEIAQG